MLTLCVPCPMYLDSCPSLSPSIRSSRISSATAACLACSIAPACSDSAPGAPAERAATTHQWPQRPQASPPSATRYPGLAFEASKRRAHTRSKEHVQRRRISSFSRPCLPRHGPADGLGRASTRHGRHHRQAKCQHPARHAPPRALGRRTSSRRPHRFRARRGPLPLHRCLLMPARV